MVEFRESKDKSIFHLIHNGKEIKNVLVTLQKSLTSSECEFFITVLGRETGIYLISLLATETEFPEYNRISIHDWELKGEVKFKRLLFSKDEEYFTFSVLVEDIENENSEIDFYSFISSGLRNKDFIISSAGFDGDFIDLEVQFDKGNNFLESALEAEQKVIKYCEVAVNRFLKISDNNHILKTFNFPKEVKIPCEQYLLYFAQFLQDLGINATSNLKEEAGKVLFSVTPTDDVEALDKIREALAVYLNLPSSPIIYDDSFAAMRLQQQIENLQHSQRMTVRELQFNEKLLVAQSEMIKEKNVTISQLQSVNEKQSKIIEKLSSKSIMIDSAENKEELEKIYEGIEVGESKFLNEKLGIKFNPAKVVKTAVNNILGNGDEIIELGLDKE